MANKNLWIFGSVGVEKEKKASWESCFGCYIGDVRSEPKVLPTIDGGGGKERRSKSSKKRLPYEVFFGNMGRGVVKQGSFRLLSRFEEILEIFARFFFSQEHFLDFPSPVFVQRFPPSPPLLTLKQHTHQRRRRRERKRERERGDISLFRSSCTLYVC